MKKRLLNSAESSCSLPSRSNKFVNKASSSSEQSKSISDSNLLLDAVKSGKDALVHSLICRGVSSAINDQFGASPLYYAARYNQEGILKMFLSQAKTQIDRPTKTLRTPLQIASYHGHVNIVRILIENKANVNLIDSLGMSALLWAAENNHAEVVRILLKAGADQTLVNKFGKTALCLALERNNYEIYEILQGLDQLNSRFLNCDDLNSSKDLHQSNRSSNEQVQENETIKLFEQHGIKLLPVDQSTIIANALQRGQTAVLTEAGKLALKKTESAFLRSISNMTNHASKTLAHLSPPKRMKVESAVINKLTETESVSKRNESKPNSSKFKVQKVDPRQTSNSTSNRKFIMHTPSHNTTKTESKKSKDCSLASVTSVNCNNYKKLELQVQEKTIAIENMKKQLQMSMHLTNHYRIKYETKEKEAELYKKRLINLSKMLTKSGLKVLDIGS